MSEKTYQMSFGDWQPMFANTPLYVKQTYDYLTLPPKGLEKKESIEELVKKQRGGKGKPRLSREAKVIRILTMLRDEKQMTSDVAYHPGHNKSDIVKFFSSSNWRDIPVLLEQLKRAGILTAREAGSKEYGDYYYYKTAKAVRTLNDLQEIEKRRQMLPF